MHLVPKDKAGTGPYKRLQLSAALRTAFLGLIPCAFFAAFAAPGSADEVNFKVSETAKIKNKDLPYTLYLSLEEAAQTRLGLDAFVDLRSIQRHAAWILSNVPEETCKRKFALAVSEVRAEQNAIVATGQVQAKFFACDTNDPKTHYRGVLLFGQNIDVVVRAAADVQRNCVQLRLEDIDLDPQGFVGTVSDLVGLTEKARALILEKGGEALADHPICPTLPDGLSVLDPRFTSGGMREIGEGGVGAALSGSVDTSAATLLDLIAILQDKHDFGVPQ